MSIVESLKKIVDPVQARNREEELRAEREQPKRDHDGDPPHYVCRVCGHEDTESSYCPTCLADTMRRVPDPRRDSVERSAAPPRGAHRGGGGTLPGSRG